MILCDIGYTNTHKNAERLHKNNIIEGIKLAEKTKDFLSGARFVWNPEVSWPLERLWESNPEKREGLIDAIRIVQKGWTTGRPWFGQRDPEKVPLTIKTGNANVDFTNKLVELENSDYPYDFTVLSWTLWDNSPLDADVPFAVKAWNEKYAYPKVIISGGHEIMSMIEEKYGKQLPVVTGDYTEYWTDGIGTAAGLTSKNRTAKERLVQAETVWSLLADGKKASRFDFDEGWRYILLGSEHTWCFENPTEPYFQDAIWKVKQSYFHEAENRSQDMMAESLAPITDKSDGALGPKEGPSNGGIAVINTHTWMHDGIIALSKAENLKGNKVLDSNGEEVLSQRLSTGELLFLATGVPALSSCHYRVVEGDCLLTGDCKVDSGSLENEFLKLHIDSKTGNIIGFVDKKTVMIMWAMMELILSLGFLRMKTNPWQIW